jgi:hypothetical protein
MQLLIELSFSLLCTAGVAAAASSISNLMKPAWAHSLAAYHVLRMTLPFCHFLLLRSVAVATVSSPAVLPAVR